MILQQLEEIVIITKDPRQLAVDEIISILSSTKYRYDFIELIKIACKNNEFVARYIGNDFHVESNKKLRSLRKRFLDGVDNRIVVVSISPLVLEWRTNKTDQNDPTDHNDQQEGKKSNIASDTTDDISDKEARLKAEDVRDVICGSESVWGTIFDWGVIVDGQERPPGPFWFTDRWIPKEKTHPLYERLNSSRRILRADSENAQEFIESRYECTNSAEADEVDLAGWLKKGYLVRDEKGKYIQENDKRLHDKDYSR